MNVQTAINTGKVSIQEIYGFIDGDLQNFQLTQKILNEISGFKDCKIELNTDEDFTIEELLIANLYDNQ